MKRTILLYGLAAGLLAAGLRALEYRTLLVHDDRALYGGVVATVCVALGIWLGRRVLGPREVTVVREVAVPVAVPVPPPVRGGAPDPRLLERVGVTPREHEVLALMADGLTTREMATRLGVSENTVKTHTARLFEKLGARRRTQAVQAAREAGLLP
ncbi:MAG: helix-turn-helix transcriptional regulator [Gemmatimonadaceae bacterium]|nr:helix-turn-helix transcriptional regulator [Gemmatimonadaceae bacterium]